jgi:hypothetical protein
MLSAASTGLSRPVLRKVNDDNYDGRLMTTEMAGLV